MLSIGQIFREYGPAYLAQFEGRVLGSHRKAVRALSACRTDEMGGFKEECPKCGEEQYFPFSCHNRACPQCHASEREKWLAARTKELLPTQYFHVIFTLPEALREVVRSHQRILLKALLDSSGGSLLKLAWDPRFVGGQIGVVAVLHTWGAALAYHPHVHCMIPAGGLDGLLWRESRKDFLVWAPALAKVFRGMFLDKVKTALPELVLPQGLWDKDWVVHVKPAQQGTEKLLQYLGRNGRLKSLENGMVTFEYKDSRDSNRKKLMRLPVFEFMRRFLQHVLPAGFHKIRYFGYLSPSNKRILHRIRLMLWGKAGVGNLLTLEVKVLKRFCPTCENVELIRVGRYFPAARSPP